MDCYCCGRAMGVERKAILRPLRDDVPCPGVPAPAAYKSCVVEMTFRSAAICQACDSKLDHDTGRAAIEGKLFSLVGASRGDSAATVDEAKDRKFRLKEVAKLGIDHRRAGADGRAADHGARSRKKASSWLPSALRRDGRSS